jgi:Xaa-Pro dipeptidase
MRPRSERILAAHPDPLDAIVIVNGGSGVADSTFRYVSGVVRGGYEGCAAVLRPGERPALVVSRLEEESAGTAPDSEIHAYATSEAKRQVLSTLLADAGRIGLNAPAIPWDAVRMLEEVAPGASFVDVGDAVRTARLVKDEAEIERVRRACALTSDVAAEIPAMLREGMTELDLSARIANAMQERGGSIAFPTIVCFGKNGSQPHYSPGRVELKRGDLVLVDFGAKLDHYCSDITRMYLFGEANGEQRRMFDVVRDAQREAVALTRAGAAARDVHRKAVEIIDATEFAGRFIHGTGHSIGLDVHDGGGLSEASDLTLEPGMIMTVEPGVYVPGVGGVRIEDTVLVTEDEPEILTPVTRDLVQVPA